MIQPLHSIAQLKGLGLHKIPMDQLYEEKCLTATQLQCHGLTAKLLRARVLLRCPECKKSYIPARNLCTHHSLARRDHLAPK